MFRLVAIPPINWPAEAGTTSRVVGCESRTARGGSASSPRPLTQVNIRGSRSPVYHGCTAKNRRALPHPWEDVWPTERLLRSTRCDKYLGREETLREQPALINSHVTSVWWISPRGLILHLRSPKQVDVVRVCFLFCFFLFAITARMKNGWLAPQMVMNNGEKHF